MKAVETDGNIMDGSQNWARTTVFWNGIIIHNRIPDDKGKKKLSPLWLRVNNSLMYMSSKCLKSSYRCFKYVPAWLLIVKYCSYFNRWLQRRVSLSLSQMWHLRLKTEKESVRSWVKSEAGNMVSHDDDDSWCKFVSTKSR